MTTLKPPAIKAVVFDMDGILINSEVIWERVRTEFANERGLRWTANDQLQLMGLSAGEWSQRMHAMLQLQDMTVQALEKDIRRRVAHAFEDHLPLREGARQAVEGLAKQWPVALASGSPRDLVELAMDRTGLRPFFQFMLTGDDVKKGKPDPEIYQRALAQLGVMGDEAVGIEDSGNGIRALRAAGMWVVAAPCPEFALTAEVRALAHVQVITMGEVNCSLISKFAS